MSTRRLGVGVAVINGQVYAVGGSDGQHPLSTVEHYDPRVGAWHRVASMSARRKHLGVAVFGGFIYAVGGRDDSTELSSAECYDARANAWCPVVAMTSRRSGVCSLSFFHLFTRGHYSKLHEKNRSLANNIYSIPDMQITD